MSKIYYPPLSYWENNRTNPMNEQADYILKIDRQQSIRSEKSIFCAQDASHGRMQITKDGMALICGAKNCSMVMMPHLIEEDSAGV